MSARIDPRLVPALMKHTGLSRTPVYNRIKDCANALSVGNDIAALAVAQDEGITINRYANQEQLAALREARRGQHAPPSQAANPSSSPSRTTARPERRPKVKPPSKNVFVVHGRNIAVRKSMFEFLRAIGLNPLEWDTLLTATRSAAPYIGDVLAAGLKKATAVVILLTPDDHAMLRKEFWSRNEDAFEKKLMGQARPNVLFEAGMAFALFPRATILVEVGKCWPFSDVFGRHIVKLNNSEAKRKELAARLSTARCPIVFGKGWHAAGDFEA
jgi:predicted nucleotide-binding protein